MCVCVCVCVQGHEIAFTAGCLLLLFVCFWLLFFLIVFVLLVFLNCFPRHRENLTSLSRKSYLQMLDPVHKQGLRLCLR